MLMLNWLCPIIYLVSMVILVSATDKTSKGDEMHRLREGIVCFFVLPFLFVFQSLSLNIFTALKHSR